MGPDRSLAVRRSELQCRDMLSSLGGLDPEEEAGPSKGRQGSSCSVLSCWVTGVGMLVGCPLQ